MSERLGRRSGPQAPSAFIKLRCQRALCGSNHLDRRIILPAQTLSKPTAEVNENESLFIYDSLTAGQRWHRKPTSNPWQTFGAGVVELVDARDSKSKLGMPG